MTLGLFIKVLGTFMDLGIPWVLAFIIDDVIPMNKISVVMLWGVVMVLLSIGARTFNIIANRMAAKVARNSVEQLRYDLFDKILCLSGAQMDRFSVPSLEARMTSDTYHIHSMIGMMQRLGVRAPIIIIGGIVITSTLEPVLTLVLVGILPCLFLTVYLVSKKGIPLYSNLQEAVDRMIRVVRENIAGIRVIKALSKTEYEKMRFWKQNEEVVDHELKAGITMAVTNPVMNILFNIGLTLVVIIGAYRVNSGASEPGKIVAFLSYFGMMLQAVMGITRIFVVFSKASASATRIGKVLDVEDDLPVMESTVDEIIKEELKTEEANKEESKTTKVLKDDSSIDSMKKNIPDMGTGEKEDNADHKYNRNCGTKRDTHIEFRQVSFSYNQEPCISDISFQIQRGGSLGIIGSTGSGKTTLINLLMRFYDVTEGSILVDGRDVRTYDKQQLRRGFGVVFQNDVLFADSIHENISFGRALSEKQVISATEDAQAAAFIEAFNEKHGFQLAIKGSNLSGGQKQRLLIARALAGKPEILILDDSSSALDYKTDSLLRKAIREHYQETTSIVIGQRISSVMMLDHILVIEDGKMAGYGSHEALLDTCQVYQEIYQSQMIS